MLDHLDARAARRWVVDVLDQLSARREEIDALNVYPVPDSDTGTNLCLTVEAGLAAVEDVPEEQGLQEVTDAFARGALLGARGSSGVILSQLLRGCADVFRERPDGGPVAVRAALARAADQAYAAVARPVEGTMLSVARAAADGAQGRTLREVVTGAVDAARLALSRTTEQLDVLGRAGVVDAGGRGLLVVLESLSETVQERLGAARSGRRSAASRGRPPVDVPTVDGCDLPPASGPGYEVMYLLDAVDEAVPPLRAALDRRGDALVVVGGAGLWNVHVHTDDVAEAIGVGLATGHVRRLRVTSFARQRYEKERERPRSETAVAAVVVGAPAQLAHLVADHAAHPFVLQAAGSGADVAELVRSLTAGSAALVPASPAAATTAQHAADLLRGAGGSVTVLPSLSFVEALAAVSVHDGTLDAEHDLRRMTDAAEAVRWEQCPPESAVEVVERLLAQGGELLTVLPLVAAPFTTGPLGSADPADPAGPAGLAGTTTAAAVDALAGHVRRHHAGVEVTVLPAAIAADGAGLQVGVE